MSDCVFCDIVAGEIPAHHVFRDDDTVAFMDIGQVNPGHVIVAATKHRRDIFEVTEEEAAAAFRTAHRVAGAVRRAFQPEGVTILQANGRAGWQTVWHFHLHVLPRAESDGVEITWPAKDPPAETLAEHAARIHEAWGDGAPS